MLSRQAASNTGLDLLLLFFIVPLNSFFGVVNANLEGSSAMA